jgi:hypothetical protein
MRTRNVFYDCEFLEDGKTVDLISIGMVDDQGASLYLINADADYRRIAKHEWLCKNVAPYVPRIHGDRRLSVGRRNPLALDFSDPAFNSHSEITRKVQDFLWYRENDQETQLWAWYGAYDHVAYAQLWGPMTELPKDPPLPMYTNELKQHHRYAGKPPLPVQVNAHNALADALWNRDVWESCEEAIRARTS